MHCNYYKLLTFIICYRLINFPFTPAGCDNPPTKASGAERGQVVFIIAEEKEKSKRCAGGVIQTKRHGVIRRCRRLTYNSSKQHRKGKEKVKGKWIR